MSNLLYMDESNGNGVYATKLNNSTNSAAVAAATAAASTTTTATAKGNNIDNIMAVTTNAAAAAAAAVAATLSSSVSNEDLSQSLSEYTDADESISAPTEFLAEFLSAVMLKDYKKALKYCKLILQYEPNNATAKEFYPLILDKLRGTASSDSDENYNKSSSPDLALDLHSAYPSPGESDEAASDNQQQHHILNNGAEDSDECIVPDEHFSGEAQSSNSSGCIGAGESLSSVSMEEDDDDDDDDDENEDDDEVDVDVDVDDVAGDDDVDVDDDDDVEEDDVDEDDVEDVMSSSGDDLPLDEGNIRLASVGLDNTSHSSRNSSSGGEGGRSRSDNTTHSYSSLLLEEEDDILPPNINFVKDKEPQDLDISNGNKAPSASCSDSESPTEPLTQRLAAILLSKCGVSNNAESF